MSLVANVSIAFEVAIDTMWMPQFLPYPNQWQQMFFASDIALLFSVVYWEDVFLLLNSALRPMFVVLSVWTTFLSLGAIRGD